MNDEIKKRIKAIVAEAQTRVDSLYSGLRVTVLMPERTQADIQASVSQALQDRESAGLNASNNIEGEAPLTLDCGVSKGDRELIERALEESRAVEGLER